ncbi:MAG: hypothetical protein PHW04_01080, partial [Candidatus Wallbacteria bacterium]|nr:hypothetical protein [Candidatus Wallbacteria bacterium]
QRYSFFGHRFAPLLKLGRGNFGVSDGYYIFRLLFLHHFRGFYPSFSMNIQLLHTQYSEF